MSGRGAINSVVETQIRIHLLPLDREAISLVVVWHTCLPPPDHRQTTSDGRTGKPAQPVRKGCPEHQDKTVARVVFTHRIGAAVSITITGTSRKACTAICAE